MGTTNMEHLNPMILTDTETGEQYTLDFDKASVVFAEQRKFEVEEVLKYPSVAGPTFFFYAFRKSHRFVPRNKTDEILKKAGGLTNEHWTRLIALYQQAQLSNVIKEDETDEEDKKNARIQIEL